MRRQLLEALPRLTRFYGLTPPDIDAMTPREVSEYLTQMEWAEKEAMRDGG